MRFEDHFIQQVRASTDIVGLISGYVNLKKQGANHSGLCPFHNEKTPSFKVNQNLQIFKCFGCGEGGDVFRFLELMEGASFPEAVRQLAERHGIPLPTADPAEKKRVAQQEKLLDLMRAASDFFRGGLGRPEGRAASAYLENRGIDAATVECFGLGFAPRGSRLLSELRRAGFSEQDAVTCGLLASNDKGDLYDKFRDRIMFPIRNLSGKVIAFGGRALSEAGPKYLNSPETPLYHKSDHLYALDVTREEIRKRNFAILVEGYFDCIVPYQFGFRNVVASLGTSLTANQARILGRYSRKVVVNFDPDSAGVAAAVRSFDLFAREGMRVNVVQLPAGADPDSYLREEGAEQYQQRLTGSLPYLEYLLTTLLEAERDPYSPRGKQAVAAQILPYLARIPDRIERAETVSQVASRLRLDEGLLLAELRKLVRPARRGEPLPLQPSPARPTPAELCLLQAALDPERAAGLLERVEPGLFEGLVTERIFQKLLERREPHAENSILYLRGQLTDEYEVCLLEEAALLGQEQDLSEEAVEGSIRALRRVQNRASSLQLQRSIARAEEQQDMAQLAELLKRKEELRRAMELDSN